VTERDETQVRDPDESATAVEPEATVTTPAPPLDSTAATPDREPSWPSPGPAEAPASATDDRGDRPELLVAGAFIGGLAVAFVLKRVASG
jgi:hypothetical protein